MFLWTNVLFSLIWKSLPSCMCQHIWETYAGTNSSLTEYWNHIVGSFWDIVGHCEIIWNISRHYKTFWCGVRYCLTFRDIVKHYVSANLWDICRAKFSWRRIFKTPFQLGFSTQNEFCHLQKTLMNRIYIAEWNLKIFHQKESFCKNVISKIIFGRIFANYPGQNWAVEQFSKTMLTRDPRQRVSNHSSFEGRGEFLGKPHNKNYIVYLEGSLSFFVHI